MGYTGAASFNGIPGVPHLHPTLVLTSDLTEGFVCETLLHDLSIRYRIAIRPLKQRDPLAVLPDAECLIDSRSVLGPVVRDTKALQNRPEIEISEVLEVIRSNI